MEYLQKLNPQQKAAVLHEEGPALVLAGAGSGKTRVLVTRAAHLLQNKGVQPEELLLLTFTNKAAGEMTERLQHLTGVKLPFAGTFHRLGVRLLRRYAELVGLPNEFTIYDSDDQASLIKIILKELRADAKQFAPAGVLAAISGAKQLLMGPAEYAEMARGQYQEMVARVFRVYEHRLQEAGAVDFDNLLTKTVQLLREHENVRQKFQDQFTHVLIDEYQDTNQAQYVLTRLLTEPQRNLFVVGDASQAIYSWRGADYHNLLRLKKDYPGLVEYRLEQNYRSTPGILEAASNVIAHNTLHPVLELWTENEDPEPLTLLEFMDGEDEARSVVRRIQRLMDEESASEIAILYRTNAQSRVFEEQLLRVGLPYRLVGGVRFYARKEVKDVLAYLAYYLNPQHEVARLRLEKLGKRNLAKFDMWAVSQRILEGWNQKPTLELIDKLLEVSGYLEQFNEKDPDDVGRLENIQELRSVASQFSVPLEFLEQVALVENDTLVSESDAGETVEPAITLMSLHAAKGLEFNDVFLVGLEEGLFPHTRTLMDKEQLEEERRLCYVGMTRARRRLHLSYARRRLLYGGYHQQVPARFLNEIPRHLLRDGSGRSLPSPHGQRSEVDMNDPSLEAVLNGDMSVEDWLRN